MRTSRLIAGLLMLFTVCNLHGQKVETTVDRVVFYNVENLFHPTDDSLTRDEEFTPRGAKYWTYKRYNTKLARIAKTVVAIGQWEAPSVVGFCEIENKKVLLDLIHTDMFDKFNYQVVHQDSPDRRGIDVGFIYRPDKMTLLYYEAINAARPDTEERTRDVLYVKGLMHSGDTIHFFVNHWPSRRGGQARSEPKRIHVAELLRGKIDSIQKKVENALIITMGDFNDGKEDKSIATLMGDDMVNGMDGVAGPGSHKYQGHWSSLDQFVISSSLRQDSTVSFQNVQIFAADFLLEEDLGQGGVKPFRTYIGPKYHDGFSDHLPISGEIHSIGKP